MQAIGIVPGTEGARLLERDEPEIQAPDEIKLRVLRVGVCGTDREQVEGGRASAPEGRDDLVIGHEMLGEVVETGDDVARVRPGDLAVFTVRRGCERCQPCVVGRSDMCRTGEFRERGIRALDGFQTEYVVDEERYVVRVPDELGGLGVLCEPLSVAEKAVDEAVRLQEARLPAARSRPAWLHDRRTLVAGLGPIGLLAALVLRLRNARVYGLDIVDRDSTRPRWLEAIGGRYIDAREVPADEVDEAVGPMDVIVEAAGVSELGFNLMDALALDGAYVLTGIPGGNSPVEVPGALLLRQLVLGNQLMVGSVNAARDHFQMAVDDLSLARARWGTHIDRLIADRHPHTEFEQALAADAAGGIKTIVEWGT